MTISMSHTALGRRMFTGLLSAAALVLPLVAASTARAESVNTTLDTLLAGGSNASGLVLGDKRYSGFSFSSSGDAPVAASGVNVALSTDDGNRYNLRFSFGVDALASSAGQTTDAVIGYRIDVLGTQRINGVGLAFDSIVGTGQSPGLAAASVAETVSSIDGISPVAVGGTSPTEVISVYNDGTGGLTDTPTSLLAVNPTSGLLFQKDILVSSRPQGGRVSISTVDNFVNQVPEPASLALFGAAAGGLLLRRRRNA